jgi:hypothetical protein
MVFDSTRGKTVMFGGNQTMTAPFEAGLLSDTWEWDGKQWSKAADAGPSKRDHHGMSFDIARGKAVVFGGAVGRQFLGDTWEWDGKQWVEGKSLGPSARGGVPSMGYDTTRKRIVLVGGWGAVGPLDDIWEWSATGWTQAK